MSLIVDIQYVESSSFSPSVILKRAPLDSYIAVTDSHDARVYLKLKPEEKPKAIQLQSCCGLQLLTVPFSTLKDSTEEDVGLLWWWWVVHVNYVSHVTFAILFTYTHTHS